jgi:hypothetical protein
MARAWLGEALDDLPIFAFLAVLTNVGPARTAFSARPSSAPARSGCNGGRS